MVWYKDDPERQRIYEAAVNACHRGYRARGDERTALLERSLELYEQLGYLGPPGQIRIDLAEVYLAAGDDERAREHIRLAQDGISGPGFLKYRRRAKAMLAELDKHAPEVRGIIRRMRAHGIEVRPLDDNDVEVVIRVEDLRSLLRSARRSS
jgi:hypothetical protein